MSNPSNPYDIYLDNWYKQRYLENIARLKSKRRQDIIEYLKTRGSVTIDNASGNIHFWNESSSKNPTFIVTFHASEEVTVQQIADHLYRLEFNIPKN